MVHWDYKKREVNENGGGTHFSHQNSGRLNRYNLSNQNYFYNKIFIMITIMFILYMFLIILVKYMWMDLTDVIWEGCQKWTKCIMCVRVSVTAACIW